VLHQVALAVEPHSVHSARRRVMFFVVAVLTQRFEVIPVQRNAWVVYVLGRQPYLVVRYRSCATASLTYPELAREKCESALFPSLALVEPLSPGLHGSPPNQKAPLSQGWFTDSFSHRNSKPFVRDSATQVSRFHAKIRGLRCQYVGCKVPSRHPILYPPNSLIQAPLPAPCAWRPCACAS
jgi:hypothetical protein